MKNESYNNARLAFFNVMCLCLSTCKVELTSNSESIYFTLIILEKKLTHLLQPMG